LPSTSDNNDKSIRYVTVYSTTKPNTQEISSAAPPNTMVGML